MAAWRMVLPSPLMKEATRKRIRHLVLTPADTEAQSMLATAILAGHTKSRKAIVKIMKARAMVFL